MLNQKQSLQMLAVLVGSLAFSAAQAEQHAGDAQPYLSAGKVQINAGLFEGDFGDLAGGLYKTDDPGFDVDEAKGGFGAGNWLQFQGVGSLRFWYGASWSAIVPAGEHVEIEDALGNVSSFTTGGVINPIGVIGQFDANGDLHEHLDFSLRNGSNALGGAVGAYWISLNLIDTLANSSTALALPSTDFNIIFNRGLSTQAYEAAVSAVPVPAAMWLFASALGALPLMGRKRQMQTAC